MAPMAGKQAADDAPPKNTGGVGPLASTLLADGPSRWSMSSTGVTVRGLRVAKVVLIRDGSPWRERSWFDIVVLLEYNNLYNNLKTAGYNADASHWTLHNAVFLPKFSRKT